MGIALAFCNFVYGQTQDSLAERKRIEELRVISSKLIEGNSNNKILIYIAHDIKSQILNNNCFIYVASINEAKNNFEDFLGSYNTDGKWELSPLGDRKIKYKSRKVKQILKEKRKLFKTEFFHYQCPLNYNMGIEKREGFYPSHTDVVQYMAIYNSENKICFEASFGFMTIPKQEGGILSIYPFQLFLEEGEIKN